MCAVLIPYSIPLQNEERLKLYNMFCLAFLQCLCVANTTKKTPLFDHNCFKTAPKRSNTFAMEKYEPNILHNFRRSEAYDQNSALKHSDGSYNTLPKIIHCSSAKSTTFHPFPSRFARNLPQTTFNGPDPQQWANKQNRASIEPIVIVHLPKRTGRNKRWPQAGPASQPRLARFRPTPKPLRPACGRVASVWLQFCTS